MMEISEHYLKTIAISPKYNSTNSVKDKELLFEPFLQKVLSSFLQYKTKYPEAEPYMVETYRSNKLQLQYYNQGASKIKENGMHHYGIACDVAFLINGKVTYNGNYKFLRQCHLDNGLFILGMWDAGHVQFIEATSTEQNKLRNDVVKAIVNFQNNKGLTSDGVIGTKTIAALREKL